MKRLRIAVFFLAVLLSVGCTEVRLNNGKYETSLPGREDFAAVYGDLIFLRVRNPEMNGTSGGYWDWAGKYEIADDNVVQLAMDRATMRKWSFNFVFRRIPNVGMQVEDLSAESSFILNYRPPVRGAAKTGSAAVAPAAYR